MCSLSTSSWILVRAWAGTPPLSPTNSSILRPASVPLRSRRYMTSARSMSMPPEARGPVLTVINPKRSEEHTSELQSHHDLVCRLLLEKKKKKKKNHQYQLTKNIDTHT